MKNSQKMVLGATGVSFVSQFFTYVNDSRGGYLTHATDERYYTGIKFTGSAGGTGWELHPQAYILLAALAIIYNTGTHESPFWTRWGHILTVVAIFLCTTPGSIVSTTGGMMGGVAIALAIWAAVLHRREQRTPPPPPAV